MRSPQAISPGKTKSHLRETFILGQERFAIALRLPESERNNLDGIGDLPLRAPGGELVRLNQIADLKVISSPELITREDARRRIVVQADYIERIRIATHAPRKAIK